MTASNADVNRTNMIDDEIDELDELVEDRGNDPRFRASLTDAHSRARLIDDLVKLRKELGLTQAVIAERMGTTQSAVSDFENGGSDYFISTAQRYARATTGHVRLVLDLPCDGPWGDVGGKYSKTEPSVRSTLSTTPKIAWHKIAAAPR